jgi:hypothetical protein
MRALVDRQRLFDWWARLIPPRYVRVLSVPLNRHMKTEDGTLYETARMLNLAFAYVRNEGIAGDYAEFGVLRGRAFYEAWLAVQRYRLHGVQLHAYDSFAGLPTPRGVDVGGPFHQGQFAASRTEFEQRTRRIPRERVTVTDGFYADTLPAADKHHIAVAFVDCDLYESTVPVLNFLSDQMVDGAVLMFDDWFCFRGRPSRGQQLACADWLMRNDGLRLVQYRDFSWSGRSFLVHRE